MAVSTWIDGVREADARTFLTTCCGSGRWVDRMIQRRPYNSDEALLHAARDIWFSLTPSDWLEAFSHHQKIGDRASLSARFPQTARLSATEQASVEAAADATLDALANLNRAYEEKFGYIFIICATGRRAEEMLELLRSRLDNDPETELRIAADEQAKITALRLLNPATRPASPNR